jgi:class 3 adenylate cyclase
MGYLHGDLGKGVDPVGADRRGRRTNGAFAMGTPRSIAIGAVVASAVAHDAAIVKVVEVEGKNRADEKLAPVPIVQSAVQHLGVRAMSVQGYDQSDAALLMALAMRNRVNELKISWTRHGYELSLGIGMAKGFATIGAIGFEGRIDYGALGTVTNLAARLCGEAQDGQILTNRKTLSEFEHLVEVEPVGELRLKGFAKPLPAFNIRSLVASPLETLPS